MNIINEWTIVTEDGEYGCKGCKSKVFINIHLLENDDAYENINVVGIEFGDKTILYDKDKIKYVCKDCGWAFSGNSYIAIGKELDKEINMKEENKNIQYASVWMNKVRAHPKKYSGRKFKVLDKYNTRNNMGHFVYEVYIQGVNMVNKKGEKVFVSTDCKLELLPQYTNWDKAREHMEKGNRTKLWAFNYKIDRGVIKYKNKQNEWVQAKFLTAFIDSQEWELL